MKQSTYEKIGKAEAWTRRVEPKWYVGWALGCALAGGLYGNMGFILIGIMYLFMAELARQRNEAATIGLKMADTAEGWRDLAGSYRALYEAERDANRDLGH